MVRGKTQMKRIENATSRQVTFSKRRNGLLKKAFELSVLCDAEVALIVFSQRGKVHEYASKGMQETICRYKSYTKEISNNNNNKDLQNMLQLKTETASLTEKIEVLESSKRTLLGENLEECSVDELGKLEDKLQKSLQNIRAAKTRSLLDQLEKLKEKGRKLLIENEELREKCKIYGETQAPIEKENNSNDNNNNNNNNNNKYKRDENKDVDIELYIGMPGIRERIENQFQQGQI